jgi:hypothetical protein
MENATVNVTTRQVGNSLAVFIPAEIKNEMNLQPNTELVIHIHKKKERVPIFGMLKGKKIEFKEEDRLDARY